MDWLKENDSEFLDSSERRQEYQKRIDLAKHVLRQSLQAVEIVNRSKTEPEPYALPIVQGQEIANLQQERDDNYRKYKNKSKFTFKNFF